MPHLFDRDYNKGQLLDLVGDMSQLAAVRRAELTEGNEKGTAKIDVFNASGLCFTVLPDRGLDIASAHYKGMTLCFRSNTGDVGPAYYEPQGYGWMRSFFGGLLTTCGMSFVGHPEIDPAEENRELGLHGRVSNIPAKGVLADACWEGEEYIARISGKVREAEVFATDLELTREITTVLGEKRLRIHDRVENLSVDRSPLMIVYHTNPGFPLLDAGTRLVANIKKSTEWLEDQEVGPEVYEVAKPPQKEEFDVVFVHHPIADEEGMVHIGLVNDSLGLGLYWVFPHSELPILNHWQHFRHGNYVTGIEPGNVSVLGRAWNRKHGFMKYIEPGEVKEFHLEMGVLVGSEEINEFENGLKSG